MRILKYILLLALLAVIGFSVYVGTQKSEFDVTRSQFIKAQKSVVFTYVNDYRNWEDFGSWKEDDPSMVFTYSDTTIGKGASYSWKGKYGEGKTSTTFEKENDSIAQKVFFSGNEGKAYLTFKDTAGGTKVTWNSKGKMGFVEKVYATFKGGVSTVIGEMQEKTLAKLDKVISHEMNTYAIKVDGVVQKIGGYYFQQKINCKISEAPKNISLVLPNMLRFFKDNNIGLTGSPFVMYTKYDLANQLVWFSVCLPMKEEIFTAEGSDYTTGNLQPFQAVKTTLNGDYSHSKEAWDKTADYLKKNNLAENQNANRIEVYAVAANRVKSPSKWVTELYIPVGSGTPVVEEPVASNANEAVRPATQSVVKPATTPTANSTSKPVVKPAAKPASTPAKNPTSKPAAKPVVKPAPKPAAREAQVIE